MNDAPTPPAPETRIVTIPDLRAFLEAFNQSTAQLGNMAETLIVAKSTLITKANELLARLQMPPGQQAPSIPAPDTTPPA